MPVAPSNREISQLREISKVAIIACVAILPTSYDLQDRLIPIVAISEKNFICLLELVTSIFICRILSRSYKCLVF